MTAITSEVLQKNNTGNTRMINTSDRQESRMCIKLMLNSFIKPHTRLTLPV